MFCDRCGARADDAAKFCSSCGKALGPTPAPLQSRVAKHVQLVGILWLALAALRVIPGLVLVAIFRSPGFPPGAPDFIHTMMPGIGILFLFGAALAIVTGVGLLTRQPWGRMLAIVAGAISLVDMPFGTAIGIYTLWALLPSEAEQEYRAMSGAA